MRLAYYAGASTAAAAACLLKAFHQRPNFYSATVYLSQSNACLLILTNLLLVLAASFMYALQRLLYGPLRPIEIEQLSEKAWYAVLDTLLAMPSFREDVGGWLLAMFTLLLAAKVWGWIGEGRVDILEQGQPPANPKLFHARLASSLVLSVLFDVWMLDYCIETVLADPRPGMMVIFTFEFAIVAVFSMFTLLRYGLALVQSRIEKQQLQNAIAERKLEIRAERAAARQNETADGRPAPASPPHEEPIDVDENEVDVPGWEEKRRYLFFLEVFTDFVKLMIYIVFFTVSITFNGLPMHIMRDVYMTFASFSKRVADYVAYRKATSDMNSRYPDATTEEIRGDACIVCRESMVAWDETPANANTQQPNGQLQQPAVRPNGAAAPPAPAPAQPAAQWQRRKDEGLRAKKLPCGHILHLRCLKAWLERQQVCPTCRRPVVVAAATANAQQGNGQGQAGQQGQRGQGQQRQGRARILNFGPLRIGFLNGPGDQIGNLLRQMQNQNQNQQNQANQQQGALAGAANQQGPNHLGLQVPYANGDIRGPNGAVTTTGLRATVPTHVQLQQIEQRIIQDAQALGLEQQQLNTLRAMETHLTYLRNLQQQQNGSNAQQRQANTPALAASFLGPNNGWYPQWPPPLPLQPLQAQPFHGNATQVLRRGDEGLPEGLVLPEGWTLTPLRPMGGAPSPAPDAVAQSDAPQANGEAAAGSSQHSAPQVEQNGDGVPRDENGSPLFVPTVPDAAPTTNGDSSVSSAQVPAAATSAEQAAPLASTFTSTTAAPSQPVTQNEDTRNPWQADGGWSFVDPPAPTSGQDTESNDQNHNSSTNGAPKSPTQESSSKGKGKQPEVEDVPDTGT